MRLYLIRHGQTVDHYNKMRQSYDAPLHEESVRILRDKQDFKNIKFDKIYVSPQQRAQETAQILFPDNEYQTLSEIYEYTPPQSLYGKTQEEGEKFWAEHAQDVYDSNWCFDGSESFNAMIQRVNKFIDLLETHNEEDQLAVVGHGFFFKHLIGVLTSKEKYTTQIFCDFLRLIPHKNGGYYIVEFNKENRSGTLIEIRN